MAWTVSTPPGALDAEHAAVPLAASVVHNKALPTEKVTGPVMAWCPQWR
jgi:hypothetical protein